MGALLSFLQRNTIVLADSLPLVHSTDSLHLKKILTSKQIASSEECKYFRERLNYFFVGRPAYKTEIGLEAKYWELPCCFIMDMSAVGAKRIYPFDSGAFLSSRTPYPRFITMMNLDEFEISKDSRAVEKLIGTLFTSRSRYFLLNPRNPTDFNRRFGIDITDEEIKALLDLLLHKSGALDDRRLSIEIQFDKAVDVNKNNVLAVVIPDVYLGSSLIMRLIEVDLKAQPLSYPVFPIKKEFHYHAIYSVVQQFYRQKGYI